MGALGKISIVVAVLLAALPAGAAAAEEERQPVPYTFDAALAAQNAEPNGAPAGSNDWSCEPTARHREPVVLVHGFLANRTVNWSTMSPLLKNNGYCVFALTYGTKDGVVFPGGFYQPGGLVKMQESARALKRFVARVRRATGARKVDIVGHSEGSLMPNYFVRFLGGHRVVDDYVGMTPLWDGTNVAGIGMFTEVGGPLGLTAPVIAALAPFCDACPQFAAGSPFIEKMNSAGGPKAPGVNYTMIMTRNDELVVPYTSGIMDGARNIVLQDYCAADQAEHLSVAYDPNTGRLILNALDPARARDICVPVLPGLGAPRAIAAPSAPDQPVPRLTPPRPTS